MSEQVNIEVDDTSAATDPSHWIAVPPRWAKQIGQEVSVEYGLRTVRAAVRTAQGRGRVVVSRSLQDALLFAGSVPYQVRYAAGSLRIGPVVGLLLGEQRYLLRDEEMDEFRDALSGYASHGGLVIAFQLHGIDWERACVYGLSYQPATKRWKHGRYALPNVIYQRAFQLPAGPVQRLQTLTGGNVFNSHRYNKWAMHELLSTAPSLAHHLPDTRLLASERDVQDMLDAHRAVVIKPLGLSRGRGIWTIRAEERTEWHLQLRQQAKRGPLLVQRMLELAKIADRPWDIRVMMQKNNAKRWQCSGIECRVAGPRGWLTNIAQGGRALTLDNALRTTFGKTVDVAKWEQQVQELSLGICQQIEQQGGHFAEFGLDLAYDVHQQLWLLEVNVRPTCYGFRQLDEQLYLRICQTPLTYAAVQSMEGGRAYDGGTV